MNFNQNIPSNDFICVFSCDSCSNLCVLWKSHNRFETELCHSTGSLFNCTLNIYLVKYIYTDVCTYVFYNYERVCQQICERVWNLERVFIQTETSVVELYTTHSSRQVCGLFASNFNKNVFLITVVSLPSGDDHQWGCTGDVQFTLLPKLLQRLPQVVAWENCPKLLKCESISSEVLSLEAKYPRKLCFNNTKNTVKRRQQG